MIVISAPVETTSGYGAHARDIITALVKANYQDIRIVSMPWGSTPKYHLNPNDPVHVEILNRIVNPATINQVPDVFIQITIPNEFQKKGKYNIGITAGIESTLCKPEWLEGCNRMDLVIATSEHSKEVFLKTTYERRDQATQNLIDVLKVNTPIEVLFEGVDEKLYMNPTPEAVESIRKSMANITEDFAFLFVGHWLQGNLGHDRKDVGMLAKVFMDTFKLKKTRPALILKTSGAGFSIYEKEQILKKIRMIQHEIRRVGFKGKLPNIYLLNGDLTDSEMAALYLHPKVKAMVSFTKGEGFGRPFLEFSLSGKPLLVSGWSGQMDFLSPDRSVLLPGALTKVHPSAMNEFFQQDSEWFTVNYGVAGQFMNDVYENYDAYKAKGVAQKKVTLEQFTLAKMSDKLKEIIDARWSTTSVAPGQIVLPKLTKIAG